MSDKPILFLDVDGVLNIFDEDKSTGVLINGHTPQRAYVPHGMKERIKLLSDNFDIVWATAWFGQAHAAFREHLELPDQSWPHLEWRMFKITEILKYAGIHPWAWVDDDIKFELDDLGWDIDRHIPDNAFLCQVDPNRGLTDDDLYSLLIFAKGYS